MCYTIGPRPWQVETNFFASWEGPKEEHKRGSTKHQDWRSSRSKALITIPCYWGLGLGHCDRWYGFSFAYDNQKRAPQVHEGAEAGARDTDCVGDS